MGTGMRSELDKLKADLARIDAILKPHAPKAADAPQGADAPKAADAKSLVEEPPEAAELPAEELLDQLALVALWRVQLQAHRSPVQADTYPHLKCLQIIRGRLI